VPPRLAFSKLILNDSLLLSTFFVVALTAAQLTSRIRHQQRTEHERERRATTLFHLTRELAGARSLDEGIVAALRQTDELTEGRSAMLLPDASGELRPHPAGTLKLDSHAHPIAGPACRNREDAEAAVLPSLPVLQLALRRSGQTLGVLVVQPPAGIAQLTTRQRDLLEAFAEQTALLIEREQLRSAREQARLLAESDRLHRTLLDSVSHELRTPLAVLRSAAESLARDRELPRPGLSAEIITATNRLNRLVANLLGQTRLESGAVRPQLDWCDVRDLIAAARRNLGDSLTGRPVHLRIPGDMPLLLADATLMEQVITNLLQNAVLYTPAGSPLTLSSDVDRALNRAYLAVADEGPGIPADIRPQLFQKFRRGDQTRGGGLGLGLSIVRGFMQAQGGDVTLEDHPGPGCRFIVHVPLREHSSVPTE
jgi:two-component system sensor histidine kinase KdpD